MAAGQYSAILGGENHDIDSSAQYSAVIGGLDANLGADGDFSIVGGRTVTCNASASFFYGYAPSGMVTMSQADSAVFYNENGISFGIDDLTPSHPLTVSGDADVKGDLSVGATEGEAEGTANLYVDVSDDEVVIAGDLSQVETETINIHALGINWNPVIAGSSTAFALTTMVSATGADASYVELRCSYDPDVGFYALDLEPGTVISQIAIEASSVGSATADAAVYLRYDTDAESSGSNTSTDVGYIWAENCPLSGTNYASTSISHTVSDDRHYYLTIAANGTSGGATAVRIYGVTITLTTENF